MDKCAKCDSENVIPDGELLDRDETAEHALGAAIYKDPDALVFAGKKRLAVAARICADCGHLELYVRDHDLDTVREVLEQRRR